MRITYIRVTLTMDGPWRVGATSDTRSRLDTEQDANERPVIPASGLAGSFRAGIGAAAEGLLGRQPTQEGDGDFVASQLWFLGTRLTGPTEARRRGATAIDRRRRAAKRGGSHEVTEVFGTEQVDLYLRLEGGDVERTLDLLATWDVTVGGGLTSGLGAAHVSKVTHRTLDLSDPAHVLARVSVEGAGPEALDRLLDDGTSRPGNRKQRPPLVTADLTIARLNVPVTRIDEAESKEAWFHGSTWKGIFRTRVEYIGRSQDIDVCPEERDGWEGCGCCTVCEVFGSGQTGAGRIRFATSSLRRQDTVNRTRNAIDRFTGGVADRKLFPERTVTARTRLRLDLLTDLEPRHTWIVKAILLTLRDMHDGLVGVGGRVAGGLGRVTVTSMTAEACGCSCDSIDLVPRLTPDDISLARTADKEPDHA